MASLLRSIPDLPLPNVSQLASTLEEKLDGLTKTVDSAISNYASSLSEMALNNSQIGFLLGKLKLRNSTSGNFGEIYDLHARDSELGFIMKAHRFLIKLQRNFACMQLCNLTQSIDKTLFYRFILIPAALIILILSFRFKRKRVGLRFCFGRPGLIFPVNLVNHQKHRFSYVAAFTFTSWVMLDLILNDSGTGGLPFYQSEILPYSKSLYLLISGIQYALIYYPMFASLTSDRVLGYALGTLYTWTLAVIFVLGECLCRNGSQTETALENAAILPPLLCFLYLSVSFPIRFITTLFCKKFQQNNTMSMIILSNEWRYVKDLMLSHKFVAVRKRKWFHKIYCPVSGFKYSISILTATTMGSCFIFMATVQILHKVYDFIELVKRKFKTPVAAEKNLDKFLNKPLILMVANYFDIDTDYVEDIYYYILEYCEMIRGCVYASLALAALSVLSSLLITLKNYKRDMQSIYRGRQKMIPRANDFSSHALLLSGARYVGYQTAYATWGFFLQFAALLIFSSSLITLVTYAVYKGWEMVVMSIIQRIWVGITVMICLLLVQNLLPFCFFTRKDDRKRKILFIDNRHLFFNFHYFAVFSNTAIGFISCPIRIIKSIIIGLWTLPRLDLSTMSRQFEKFDPGYVSYVCLLHLENAHRNPTMLLAVRFFLESLQNPICQFSKSKLNDKIMYTSPTRRKMIRNRWYVFLTLWNNPSLKEDRKKCYRPDVPSISKQRCDFYCEKVIEVKSAVAEIVEC